MVKKSSAGIKLLMKNSRFFLHPSPCPVSRTLTSMTVSVCPFSLWLLLEFSQWEALAGNQSEVRILFYDSLLPGMQM